MPKSTDGFAVHDRVRHSAFGTGTIKELSERYMTIAFDEVGTRKFLNEIVRLERSTVPAPDKPVRVKKAKAAPKAAPKAAAKEKAKEA